MIIDSKYYPYLIGLVIIIVGVLFGLKLIPFEIFISLVMTLLGFEGAALQANITKTSNLVTMALGKKPKGK